MLVAVQSIGTPYDGTDDGIVWPLLDQAVSGVGGTAGVLAADQQGYSLLGGVGIGTLPLAEASQTATGAPAHVTAVLERGRSWAYGPASHVSARSTPLRLLRSRTRSTCPDRSRSSVQLDNASQLAAAQFSWSGLLPTVFELAELPRSGSNSGVTDARNYTCSYTLDKTSQSYHPFPNAPLSSQVLSNDLYTLVENGSALPDDHLVKETPKTPRPR